MRSLRPFVIVLLALSLGPAIRADYLGTQTVRGFVDPESIPVIEDGIDLGDEIGFILEATPRDTGSIAGHASWMTLYVPAGTEVIGVSVVLPNNSGTFDDILAEATDRTYDGCGRRKCKDWSANDTVNVTFDEGFVNEVQQDAGIFYSTDPRTAIIPTGVDRDMDGNPDPLTPTGIKNGTPITYNEWDFDQTLAFGQKNALVLSAAKQGQGNTPVVQYDDGTDAVIWAGTGSPVAGPDAFYTNDYNPDCDRFGDGTLAEDLTCSGPWNRIAYGGSSIGGSGPVVPVNQSGPTTGECDETNNPGAANNTDCIVNTAVSTGSGWALSGSNPLPAGTNAVRYVHGKRRMGDLEFSRFTLRVTDVDAFRAALTDDTFCLEAIPGDTSDIAAKDNNWRYYEPSHRCVDLSGAAALTKKATHVNGVTNLGYNLQDNDIVSYEITFLNLGDGDLTDVMLSDAPIAGTALEGGLLEPGNASCAYPSYDGDLGAPEPPNYQAGTASSNGGNGPAVWDTIPTLAPGESVTIHMCAQVNGVVRDFARNEASVTYTLPGGGTETLTAEAFGILTSCIQGTVYKDNDGTGGPLPSPGDEAHQYVTVELYIDDGTTPGVLDAGDSFADSTTTLSDGSYAFYGVGGDGATDFLIVEYDPVGYDSTGNIDTNTCGASGLADACNVIFVENLAAGACSVDNDFFDEPNFLAALISDFRLVSERGLTVAEWETGAESGTTGFYLLRWNDQRREWLTVHDRMIPALGGAGGTYRVADPASHPRRKADFYALVEVEAGVRERLHGPYEARWELRGDEPALLTQYARHARRPTAAMLGRLRLAAQAELAGPTAFGSAASPAEKGSFLSERKALPRMQEPRELPRTTGVPGRGGETSTKGKVAVREDGIHFLANAQIASLLGVAEPLAASWVRQGRIRLTNQGLPVAWLASNDGLQFFGLAPEGIFTRDNIYWLEAGAGVTMGVGGGPVIRPPGVGIGSFRETIRFEEQVFAATLVARDPSADFWFWSFVNAGDPTYGSRSFSFDVPDLAPTAGDARLVVRLHGATDTVGSADHHAVIRVNGSEVDDGVWDGIGEHRLAMVVPRGILQPGLNSLEIEGLLGGGVPHSSFYIDAFELTYDRRYQARGDRLRFRPDDKGVVSISGFSSESVLVFDVTDPALPLWVANAVVDKTLAGSRVSFIAPEKGREYVAVADPGLLLPAAAWRDTPSELRDHSGAEYLAIAPAQLLESAQVLADHRGNQGLQGLVVDLEDVYDEFNHGLASPHAVRDFLAWAWNEWSTRPRFAALVGAGNLDYKDYQGLGGNLFPPLLVSTPTGLFAADQLFGDVVGQGFSPEIAVGRIPVLTAEELDAYVDKLVAFETQPPPARALMLADDSDVAGGYAEISDWLAGSLPPSWSVGRIYLSQIDPPTARAQLFAELRQGASWANWAGHGGLQMLAHEGLLTNADVPTLGNEGLTPVVSALTCSIARFELPGWESLGEALVVAEGGAVAVWAPAGLAATEPATALGATLFERAFVAGDARLGEAVLHAVQGNAGVLSPLTLEVFNLLGDPAVQLP